MEEGGEFGPRGFPADGSAARKKLLRGKSPSLYAIKCRS